MAENDLLEAASTALIPEVLDGEKKDVGKRKLTVREVAQMLGVDEGAVYRRAGELGAKRTGTGRLIFELERIRVVQQTGIGRKAAAPPPAAQKAVIDGERDARVFEALEAGKTISEIVISTRTAAETVIHLRKLWLESKRADLEGVVHMCMGCHAVPGNPAISYCTDCGPKARVLTDAQIATLKDKA